jgi:hypothetical protein
MRKFSGDKELFKELKKKKSPTNGTYTSSQWPCQEISLVEGHIEGRNHRGRAGLDYMSQFMRDIKCGSYFELKRKAENREVESCCQRACGLLSKEISYLATVSYKKLKSALAVQ